MRVVGTEVGRAVTTQHSKKSHWKYYNLNVVEEIHNFKLMGWCGKGRNRKNKHWIWHMEERH